MVVQIAHVDWRYRAGLIDIASGGSFLLLALTTLLMYFGDKQGFAPLIRCAEWVAMGLPPLEFGVAIMATSFAWRAWRYRSILHDHLHHEEGQCLTRFFRHAVSTVHVAWLFAVAAIAVPFSSHLAEIPALIPTVTEVLGVTAIFYGMHWHLLGVYPKLARLILVSQQSPVVRHLSL